MNRLKSPLNTAQEKKIVASLMGSLHIQMQDTARKERFLGRECEVYQVSAQTPEGRVQSTAWNARVGGHDVGLRTLTKTFKNGKLVRISLTEAINIQVVPQPPSGLLQIPRDYKITDMDPNLILKDPNLFFKMMSDPE